MKSKQICGFWKVYFNEISGFTVSEPKNYMEINLQFLNSLSVLNDILHGEKRSMAELNIWT